MLESSAERGAVAGAAAWPGLADLPELTRQMLDAITVPAYAHAGGLILHANAPMLRLAGRSLDAMRACRHGDIAAEPWREALQAYGDACISNNDEPPAMELALCNSQGDQRPVEINARRLALGQAPLVVVTCQDLSDIQHVQNSMLNLSQVLHQIINGGPLATFVVDKEQRITHWNRACQLLTGIAPYQVLGTTDSWRALYPDQRPLQLDLVDLVVCGVPDDGVVSLLDGAIQPFEGLPGAYEGELLIPRENGEARWMHVNAAPLRDANGEIIGAVQTMQDVTQRRQAEEELLLHRNQLEKLVAERSAELRKTVDQLATFMENSPLGVVHIIEGEIRHHNRVFAEMFGLEGATLVGQRGADFFVDRSDYSNFIQQSLATLPRGRSVQREVWMRRDEGPTLFAQVIGYATDQQDPQAGSWWLVQDRTAVRQAQDELRSNFERMRETNQKLEEAQNQLLQQDKMASIGQLAAGVAHEINNPIGFVGSNLHSLKNYVQQMMLLIDTYQGVEARGLDAQALADVQRVKQTVEIDYLREDLPQLLSESEDGLARVKRIVQDLKDFSRVDQTDWQDADLNVGLESTLNVVMHEVKYKATVVRHLQPLPLVRCLAAQLNQVFLNLIVNASHAITGNGTITLSSAREGDWVWIEVADSGSGMSEAVMKRVFEPFFTTKAVGKGTGLGLSLSFSIVQRHAGAIRVRSSVGQGSAFKVWVPIAGPASNGSTPAPPVDY